MSDSFNDIHSAIYNMPLKKAYEFLLPIAKEENSNSFYYIASVCKKLGKHNEAILWYNKSCNINKDIDSCGMVAFYHLHNNKYEEAIEMFSSINNATSIFALGKMYQSGYGVKKNLEKAEQYFKKGAKKFHVYATRDYGKSKKYMFQYLPILLWAQLLHTTFNILLKVIPHSYKLVGWIASRLDPVWAGWGDRKMVKKLAKDIEQDNQKVSQLDSETTNPTKQTLKN